MKATNPITCIIIDDEFPAVKLIADYVAKTGTLKLLLSTTSALEALSFLNSTKVDLIFLDVQMPEVTGIELMNVIKNTDTKVVLTTAYSDYALEGYTHDIVDYLLKPITFERFLVAFNKVQKRLFYDQPVKAISSISPQYIFVKTEYRVQKVMLSAILYIEGLGDYITIHTIGGKLLSLERMKNLEGNLPTHDFIRIHKSYIINSNHIDFIEKGRIVINKEYLPIGESYKEKVRKQLGIKL